MLTYSKLFKRVKPTFVTKRSVGAVKSISTNQARAMSGAANRYKYNSYNQSSYNRRSKLYPLAALSVLSLVGGYEMLKNKLKAMAECCGIIGYIGPDKIAGKLVLDGIQILQYRGYDS